MPRLLVVFATACAIPVAVVLAHFAFIEIGREVVTLRTENADGSWRETRLWVADYDGDVWLHSAGAAWERRFEGNPVVELVRHGEVARYRAEPDRSAHADIDAALRAKYGVADRWVRFLAPCDGSVLPVRLHRLPPT